jgi:hypothetical protein
MSVWQELAAKMFVKSARQRAISGDGQFMLLSKCPKWWKVLLFPTEEARREKYNEWAQNGCGTGCNLSHDVRRLTFPAQPESRPAFRKPFEKEPNSPKIPSLVDVLKETQQVTQVHFHKSEYPKR